MNVRRTLASLWSMAAITWLGTYSGDPVAVAQGPTPIVEYRFEEGGGGWAVNTGSLGAAANGGFQFGPTYSTTTPSGGGLAVSLDGVNDYLSVADAWDYTNQLTIEAWLRPDQIQGERVIWDDYGGPGVVLKLVDGVVNVSITTTNAELSGWAETALTPANQWTHVALVYDGTQVRVYSNGILRATGALTGPIVDNPGNPNGTTKTAAVGRDNITPALHYDGLIDDFRIFNAALTLEQLAGGEFASSCPAARIAGNAYDQFWPSRLRGPSQRRAALDQLRHFRDQVLAQSPQGEALTRIYYAAAPEVTRLVVIRPDLIGEIVALMAELLPQTNQPRITLTTSQYRRGLRLIDQLADMGSSELKAQLEDARDLISRCARPTGGQVRLSFDAPSELLSSTARHPE